jgi:hypothetical protein
LVNTAFSPVYFLSKKDPAENTSITNLKITDETELEHRIVTVKPSFTRLVRFLFHLTQAVYIVSDYRLDDRAIGVRSPAGAEDFSSSLCVQTGSGAHPASCTMGTGGPFLGGKARPGRDADHSPPSNAEVVNE